MMIAASALLLLLLPLARDAPAHQYHCCLFLLKASQYSKLGVIRHGTPY
jgi:hypothetical protein